MSERLSSVDWCQVEGCGSALRDGECDECKLRKENANLRGELEEAKEDSERPPLEITLGTGRYFISSYQRSGECGLLFQDTEEPHEIGSEHPELAGKHYPENGDIYIHCANVESAKVLLHQASKMVEEFKEAINTAIKESI